MSITYLGIAALLITSLLGTNASSTDINTFLVVGVKIALALVGLYGRYRAGGITVLGVRE
mgnify:CR=1 FL=1